MSPSKMPEADLRHGLATLFAGFVRDIGLELVEAHEGSMRLRLPILPRHVHSGGVLCGQAMMAAADTSMVLAIMTQLGEFRPMTTAQLQTGFLRPIAAPRTAGKLAAHATTTYALL